MASVFLSHPSAIARVICREAGDYTFTCTAAFDGASFATATVTFTVVDELPPEPALVSPPLPFKGKFPATQHC